MIPHASHRLLLLLPMCSHFAAHLVHCNSASSTLVSWSPKMCGLRSHISKSWWKLRGLRPPAPLIHCGRNWTRAFTHCRDGLSILIHWAGQLLLFLSPVLLPNKEGGRDCAQSCLLIAVSTALLVLTSACHLLTSPVSSRWSPELFSGEPAHSSSAAIPTGSQEAAPLLADLFLRWQFVSTEKEVWMFKEICGHWYLGDFELLEDFQIAIAR